LSRFDPGALQWRRAFWNSEEEFLYIPNHFILAGILFQSARDVPSAYLAWFRLGVEFALTVDPFMDTSCIEHFFEVVLYFLDEHSTSIKSFDVAVFVI